METNEILNRLFRLEKQNRRMKILLFVLFVAGCGIAAVKDSGPSEVIETQKLVIKDKEGNKRVVISSSDKVTEQNWAGVKLYTPDSTRECARFGTIAYQESKYAAHLHIYGGEQDKSGFGKEMMIVSSSGFSLQNGHSYEGKFNRWDLNASDTPSLKLTQNYKDKVILGCAELQKINGDKITTEPTIVIFDNKGNVIYEPRQ